MPRGRDSSRSIISPVAEGVFRLRLGRTNAYVVRDGDAAFLIDTGLPSHAPVILQAMAELAIPPRAVRCVLLTHRHLDHAGGARALALACGAPVVVHEADAAAVAGEARLSPTRGWYTWPLGQMVAFFDHRVFGYRPCAAEAATDGWRRGPVELVHLPGHTPGHSGYMHASSGVIFAGDAATGGRGGPGAPSRLFTTDPTRAASSIRRLAGIRAAVYCFGHGCPIPDGAAALGELAQRPGKGLL